MMWSIGNEIPDSTSAAGVADRGPADRRGQGGRQHPPDRDRLRPVPQRPRARLAAGPDPAHARRPRASTTTPPRRWTPCTPATRTCSSSSRSRPRRPRRAASTRSRSSSTPARTTPRASAATSSYDNNLASWTMSGEYGLKKDRDRKWFAGQFLWSGIDYIGEPTPYDVFPVKASFFGAVDTAGFPKDMYYLFQSQWIERAHGPSAADELDHARAGRHRRGAGPTRNVDTVELFLNGKSLGTRRFDAKKTVDGAPLPGDHRGHRRRQDRHRRPVPRQLHQPQRQRGQAAPHLESAVRRPAS